MYAAQAGRSTLGIPKSVGKDYIAASRGVTGLPAKAVGRPRKALSDEFGM